MEEKVIIAYAILLTINTVIFILCVVQMRKFNRLNRNFNKVVNNVQSYLQCIMEEDEQENDAETETTEETRQKGRIMELDWEVPDKEPMPDAQKEAILNSVLGELFS